MKHPGVVPVSDTNIDTDMIFRNVSIENNPLFFSILLTDMFGIRLQYFI